MKKLFVLSLFTSALAKAAFALNPYEYKVFYKLSNNTTISSLSRYLDVNDQQLKDLQYIFAKTERKLDVAFKKRDAEAAKKAMYFNLANAKHVLNEEQYKKYLMALNASKQMEYSNEYIAAY